MSLPQDSNQKSRGKPAPIRKDDFEEILYILQGLSFRNLAEVRGFLQRLSITRIEEIHSAYAQLSKYQPDLPQILSRGDGFRQLRPPGWPDRITNIHYEFMQHGQQVWVEIHLEPENAPWRPEFLQRMGSLVPRLQKEFPDNEVTWQPINKGYSLRILFDEYCSPRVVAEAMEKFIRLTRQPIQDVI